MGGAKSEVPGPGQYHKEKAWVKQRNTNTWDPKDRVPAQAINLNPPSIPSHNYVFGYEEDLQGKLI